MKTSFLSSILIFALFFLFAISSCINDDVSASPSVQPQFSCDTLSIGNVISGEVSPSVSMKIYNKNNKGLNIESIRLTGADSEYVRLNVDGISDNEFQNVEIRSNDSIFIFAVINIPDRNNEKPVQIDASMEVIANGVKSIVPIGCKVWDVIRIEDVELYADTKWDSKKPYLISGALTIASAATLEIAEGARLLMRDKASIVVNGHLCAIGFPGNPIVISGDRFGDVFSGVSFDIMPGQWEGITFNPSSTALLEFVSIVNNVNGVIAVGDPMQGERPTIKMKDCRLHNSRNTVFAAQEIDFEAYGCEFSEGGSGVIRLKGGNYRLDHCTVANNYLFGVPLGAKLQFDSENKGMQVYVTNSVLHGMGQDVEPGDLSGWNVVFENCAFGNAGSDDDNFVKSHWEIDPSFYTDRSSYYFDYRLKADSPLQGLQDASISLLGEGMDRYGNAINAIGAYAIYSK